MDQYIWCCVEAHVAPKQHLMPYSHNINTDEGRRLLYRTQLDPVYSVLLFRKTGLVNRMSVAAPQAVCSNDNSSHH